MSDAETPSFSAFTDENRVHQLDLVHVVRTTSYKLWEDGALPLSERKQIVSEVKDDLFHLKNAVENYRPAGDRSAIKSRIDSTTNRLHRLARQLTDLSCQKTAAYLRSWMGSIVTFAEEATHGVAVPWTSNAVERAMGEVSKRCKNQGMRWTEQGLEEQLQLLLTKYANPDHYDEFAERLLSRSTKRTMGCDVSVAATRGHSKRLCNTASFLEPRTEQWWLFRDHDAISGSFLVVRMVGESKFGQDHKSE